MAQVLPFRQQAGEPLIAPTDWGFSQQSYAFLATKVVSSDRYRDLERKGMYFACSQHDHKRYNFDGVSISQGPYTVTQPLIGNLAAPFYIPLTQRRPSAPLRLGKQIVNSFTKLVFGEDRFPDIVCKQDEVTQDFLKALSEEAKLQVIMIQARDKAGSQGAVGISWYFHNGKPVVEVHDVKTLHVHAWADKSNWRPAHVTKCYKHRRPVWDADRKQIVDKEFWYRRDWTQKADILYVEVEAKSDSEPAWQIDEARSSVHGDGFCHLIWMQNVPDKECADGRPDYDGLYEKLDELDVLNSVVCRGTKSNCDPTLVLKMEQEAIGGAMVRKGTDHALAVGEDGAADYLEISGSGLKIAMELIAELKQQALDEAECVIPDPDKVAAGSVSSVTLQLVYAPMMSRTSLMRTTSASALQELLGQMLKVCRKRWTETETTEDEQGNAVEREVSNYLDLPPRVVEEPVVGEDGKETGEVSIEIEEREPGEGERFELSWGPYFKPNANDLQLTATTMSTATGGKAVVSQKAAVEVMAGILGKDPAQMLREIEQDNRTQMAVNGSMFGMPGSGDTMSEGDQQPPQAGQQLDPEAELEKGAKQEAEEHGLDDEAARKIASDHLAEDPAYYSRQPGLPPAEGGQQAPGGKPQASTDPFGGAEPAELSLTSSDLAIIVQVNVALKRYGLQPLAKADGSPDPDGFLTIAEFKAKRAKTVAEAAMADKGQDPSKPPPAAPPPFGAKGAPPPFGAKKPQAGAEEGADAGEQGKPPFPPKG